jgi:hypothetical protein
MPAACKTLPTWPAGGAGGDALPSFSMVASWRRQQVAPIRQIRAGGELIKNRLKLTAKSWRGDKDTAGSVK